MEAAVEIQSGHSGAPASRAGLERFVKMVSRNKLYFRCSYFQFKDFMHTCTYMYTVYILVKKIVFEIHVSTATLFHAHV